MTLLETIILAIVEGLTEFLPISSTGHLMLTQAFLGMQSTEYVRAFTVFIQLGAILSVVTLYWKRFFYPFQSEVGENNKGRVGQKFHWKELFLFYSKLIVACLPAAIAGVFLEPYIDHLLSNVYVFAVMLLLGGILMLFVDKLFASSKGEKVSFSNAFFIGLYQCIAMIPGVSRSMATIVGGQQQGLSRKQAAEFSFFLAVPVMFGATLLKAYKLFQAKGMEVFVENATSLILGNIVAFIVAIFAMRFFINFLTKFGFKYFGYYRIVVGLLILILLFAGVSLELE